MKKIIETFESTADWTLGTGVTLTENDHPEYIADRLGSSLLVNFTEGNGISKDLSASPIDVSDYEELTFHLISFDKSRAENITNGTFYYTLDIGDGKIYYIETLPGFDPVTIYIGGTDEITKIEFTAVGSFSDDVILSGMVASNDELPLDIFTSVRDELQEYLNSKVSFNVGTVASGSIGDVSVTVADPQWIEANCIVKIASGGNEEFHHIRDFNGGVLSFSTLYDGEALVYDHTDAVVSFYIPVYFGTDKEIILPGITLWEDNEEVEEVVNREVRIYDTRTATDIKIRKQDRFTRYQILVDIEAWQTEIMKVAKQYTRNWLEREGVWINGKNFHFEGSEKITTNITSRVEGIDIVPKTQYLFKIQIGVSIWDRETEVMTISQDLTLQQEQAGQ